MKKIVFLIMLAYFSTFAKDIDLDKIVTDTQKQDKQIMIFMHIPHCPYCERMEKENFQDKTTLQIIEKNFLFIDIDAGDTITFKSKKSSHKKFAKSMEIPAFPSTLFMSQSGEVLYKSIGYRNTDEYLTEMQYISTKSYKLISLEKFAENLEFEKDD